MSNKAITWAFEQPLQPTHKIVLLVLADTANPKTDECWPSIRFIAERACISEDTVIRALKELASGGYITKEARFTEAGRQTTCLYRLSVSVDVHQGRILQGGGSQIAGEEGRNCATPYEPKEGTPSEAKASSGGPRTKGSRLEEGFEPNETCIALARELGIDDLPGITAQFIDHWTAKAGKEGVKLDWQAAFRTWLRNEVKFNRRSTNGHGRPAAARYEDAEERRRREIYERHLVR